MIRLEIIGKEIGFLLSLTLSMLLSVGISTARAQTLYGETPAEESVCGPLVGGTPGLYGLCVAYCEAQDLDGYDFNNPETHKKAAPNRKILENYRKKMDADDPDMPCLGGTCPCWEESYLLVVTAENVQAGSCGENQFQTTIRTTEAIPGVEGGFSVLDLGAGGFFCATRDRLPHSLDITIEEYRSCLGHIDDRCTEIGN